MLTSKKNPRTIPSIDEWEIASPKYENLRQSATHPSGLREDTIRSPPKIENNNNSVMIAFMMFVRISGNHFSAARCKHILIRNIIFYFRWPARTMYVMV